MAKSIRIMFAFGAKNPHTTSEHERDPQKINMFCAIFKNHVDGLFLFEENVTDDVYLQMV